MNDAYAELLKEAKHYHVRSLSDLLGQEVLEILATGLCRMTDRPLGIVELRPDSAADSDPLERDYHYVLARANAEEEGLANFCSYCRAIRACEKTKAECWREEFDIVHDFQVGTTQSNPFWRICQFGLVDFAIPIIVNKRALGVFFVGQYRLDIENSDRESHWKERYRRKVVKALAHAKQLYDGKEDICALFEDCNILRATTQELDNERKKWIALAGHIKTLAEEKYATTRELHDVETLDKLLYEVLYRTQVTDEEGLWQSVGRALEVIRRVAGCEAASVLERQGKKFVSVAQATDPEKHIAKFGELAIPAKVVLQALSGRSLQMDKSTASPVIPGTSPARKALNDKEQALMAEIQTQLSPFEVKCLAALSAAVPGAEKCLLLHLNRSLLPGRKSVLEFSRYCTRLLGDAATLLGAYIRDRLATMEAKRLMERLRDSQAAHSHKMNAALQAIYGKIFRVSRLAHKIDRNEGKKALIIEEMGSIRRTLERMRVLARVVGFVAGSQGATKKLELNPKRELKVRSLVMSCVEELQDLAQNEGSLIKHSLPQTDAVVECNEHLIFIALINILDNAIKYSFTREDVHVGLEADGGEVRIEVKNYGVGVPSGQQGRVFELYWRANVPYGMKASVGIGTGIGLTVAILIAEAHGGRIEFASTPPKPSDKYEGRYTAEDIEKGFCYTTEVTLVLPRKEQQHGQ